MGAGILVAGKDAKYEHDTVSVARAKVAEAIEQRQTDGWELVDQDQGILRTKLTFRRPKPPDRTLLWVGAVLAVGAVAITIGVISERARDAQVTASAPPAATSPAAPTPTTPPAKPTRTPSPTPTTTQPEPEPEPGVLWTKADGPATFMCMSGNRGALVRFDLPASWEHTDELNAILREFDGRKPVTVLTVTNEYAWDSFSLEDEYDHPILTRGDPTSFIGLTLETSKGTVTINDYEPGSLWSVSGVLWDAGLIDPDRKVGSKKLRARADALVDRTLEDDGEGGRFTSHFVLPRPITHMDSARAEFLTETDRYYPECVKEP